MQEVGRNTPCSCGSGKKFKNCHGANRPIPPVANISSISIDRKRKQTIVVTKDILVNQILRDGPAIAESFDKITRDEIREISAVIADSFSLCYRHIPNDTEEYKPTCSRLLFSSLTAFMASVEVARHGFRRQYGAAARSIVETLATILCLAVEPEALADFHAGRLRSTKSISSAKKVLPPFGQAYGMLSEHFVHINKAHATYEPIKKYEKNEESLRFVVSTLRSNAWLIYVVAELVFHDEISNPRYWKSLGGGAFLFDPSEEERAWQKAFLTAEVSL